MSGLNSRSWPRVDIQEAQLSWRKILTISLIVTAWAALLCTAGARQLAQEYAYGLAIACTKHGEDAACKNVLARATSMDTVELARLRALYAQEKGDTAGSIASLEWIAQKRVSWPYAWFDLAKGYASNSQFTQLEHALEHASRLGPHERNRQLHQIWLGMRHWENLTPKSRVLIKIDVSRALIGSRFQTLSLLFRGHGEALVCSDPIRDEAHLAAWCQNIAEFRKVCRSKWHIPRAREWCTSRKWVPDTLPRQ